MYGQTVIARRARCHVIRSEPFLAQSLGGKTWGKTQLTTARHGCLQLV
jgi:hypothetical protein